MWAAVRNIRSCNPVTGSCVSLYWPHWTLRLKQAASSTTMWKSWYVRVNVYICTEMNIDVRLMELGLSRQSSLKIDWLEERCWRPNARFGSTSENWICRLTGLRATADLKIAVFLSCGALCFDKYRSFFWNCCLCPQGRSDTSIYPKFQS